MSKAKLIKFTELKDKRGLLVAVEGNKDVPFDIKRIYYITHVAPGISRGFHAHKNLSQVAVCVRGSCRFVLDDGSERIELTLNDPTSGLLIDGMKWREMHDFSEDCVLMVFANQYYDESDYIRDYDEFLKTVVLNSESINSSSLPTK